MATTLVLLGSNAGVSQLLTSNFLCLDKFNSIIPLEALQLSKRLGLRILSKLLGPEDLVWNLLPTNTTLRLPKQKYFKFSTKKFPLTFTLIPVTLIFKDFDSVEGEFSVRNNRVDYKWTDLITNINSNTRLGIKIQNDQRVIPTNLRCRVRQIEKKL